MLTEKKVADLEKKVADFGLTLKAKEDRDKSVDLQKNWLVVRSESVGGIMAARKIRSDSTVKAAEKRLGIKNAIRNADGSNARSDKKIGTLRKEAAKTGKK
jgi:hypothetical protein